MGVITEKEQIFSGDSKSKAISHLVPPDVMELLGDPPLVHGEDPEHYHRIFNQLAASIVPVDFIEWTYTKDILDLVWEIKRWRAVRSAFFESEQLRIGSHLVSELLEEAAGGYLANSRGKARHLVVQSNTGDPESQQQLDHLMTSKGLSQQAIMSHALVCRLHDIERLEKLIASAEKRRDDLLKNIDNRRHSLAKRLKEATDAVIDDITIEETPTSSQAIQ